MVVTVDGLGMQLEASIMVVRAAYINSVHLISRLLLDWLRFTIYDIRYILMPNRIYDKPTSKLSVLLRMKNNEFKLFGEITILPRLPYHIIL